MKTKLIILSKKQQEQVLKTMEDNKPLIYHILKSDDAVLGKIKEKINTIYHIFEFVSEFDIELGVILKTNKETQQQLTPKALTLYRGLVIQLIDFQNNKIVIDDKYKNHIFMGEQLSQKLHNDNVKFIESNFDNIVEFENLRFLRYKDPLLLKITTQPEYDLIKHYYELLILLFVVIGIRTNKTKLINIKDKINKKLQELKIN